MAQKRIDTKSIALLISVSVFSVFIGYLQNRYGQFSDIRTFFARRFADGTHHWPYDTQYVPPGETNPLSPIEYPALTGLIVWGLTYLIPESINGPMNYFHLNLVISGMLFVASTLLVMKIANRKLALVYAVSPAVVLGLTRNWDIWAVLPLLIAIWYFEKTNYRMSALVLSISIATKFFPIVILLPASIYFLREKKYRMCVEYCVITLFSWLVINLPFILSNFSGWLFFYKFSFQRSVGDGSFFNIFVKFGWIDGVPLELYYSLNCIAFVLIGILLWRSKQNWSLSETAFFAVFAFTIFGKQYSMQYVIWLAPLALIALRSLKKSKLRNVELHYIAWQIFEYLFQKAYFDNYLTRVQESRGIPLTVDVSDREYAIYALLRYFVFVAFVISLVLQTLRSKYLQKRKTSSAKFVLKSKYFD